MMPVSPPISMVTAASSEAGSSDPVEVRGEAGSEAKGPVVKGLPDVEEPSPEDVAKHSLTHIPYRRWCKYCVAARMASFQHWTMPPFSRACPLFVADYCFLKHRDDEAFLTVLVERTYPSTAIFACPCDAKGADPFATRRLAAFFRACRMPNFTYMCDQESALRVMIEESLHVTEGRGEWVGAIPENSAFGESQSNGKAERAVQALEDQTRTLLGELEDRLGVQFKSGDAVLAWLVEYAAVLLNKYHPDDATGVTAYQHLHGQPAGERLAYFRERLFFLTPKRRRSNLELRWAVGVYLGTLMTSNEAMIGLPNGDVCRARSVARLIPSNGWKKEAVLAIRGTPARPVLKGEDDAVIESVSNPHLHLDAELQARLEGEGEHQQPTDLPVCLQPDRKLPSLRITKPDLLRYGYTGGCPRCLNTKVGDNLTNSNHWDSCRRRIYRAMYREDDPKLHRWLRDHPNDTTKVGQSLLPSASQSGGSSSPTAPPPQDSSVPSAPMPPGELHVLEEANEDDITAVVAMLVGQGVQPIDAQRLVTNLVKGTTGSGSATGFFELYGQGGTDQSCQKVPRA